MSKVEKELQNLYPEYECVPRGIASKFDPHRNKLLLTTDRNMEKKATQRRKRYCWEFWGWLSMWCWLTGVHQVQEMCRCPMCLQSDEKTMKLLRKARANFCKNQWFLGCRRITFPCSGTSSKGDFFFPHNATGFSDTTKFPSQGNLSYISLWNGKSPGAITVPLTAVSILGSCRQWITTNRLVFFSKRVVKH